VAGGEVRADGGDHHVGAADGCGGDGGGEEVGCEQDLDRLRGRGLRRGAVDRADLMAALRGEGHDMGADAPGRSEYGELHG
jgi:hypothetical protein